MYVRKGIDVSYSQKNVNWSAVKTSGIEFAILRAGFGREASQKDDLFENNYTGCKSNSIPCGCYWYSYATSADDAVFEAKACIEVLKGRTFEYPIYFDIEELSQLRKGKDFCTSIAKAFLETVEKAGYWVGLYMSKSILDAYMSEELRSRYAVWVAQYNSSCTYRGKYGIWQYGIVGDEQYDTKNELKINGITGRCDVDLCYVDYPTLIKKAGLNGFKSSNAVVNEVKKTEVKSDTLTFNVGDAVTLNSTLIFSDSISEISSGVKSGTYYIYSGEDVNGRYAVTNSIENVSKKPAGQYVTGWVKKSEMTLNNSLSGYIDYVIQEGDTLWGIAQSCLKNGSRYNEIKNINGLTSDTIYAGQKIKIPKF